jgi:ornithine decarboxylase
MHNLVSISSLVAKGLNKSQFVFRPNALKKSVNYFREHFPGQSIYAVKTNSDPLILKQIYQNGIKGFDVASLGEVKLIYDLFDDAEIFFMNPVKSRNAIKTAYFDYGVRHFSLDHEHELDKILSETNNAKDLNLHVRIAIPNSFAEISLSDKFGVNLQQAPELIKKTAKYAKSCGVCFHVGSQSMHPDSYLIAIRTVKDVIAKSDILPKYFNVGGGFPSIYPGFMPPSLKNYFKLINKEFKSIPNSDKMHLLAEPGRAIVAESMSLIVKVELRKDDYLYINDGTYGSLFDAGVLGFVFPSKLINDHKINSTDLTPFSFYGPTCDSLDYMKGPFYLPNEIKEGDYIEIGQVGAYAKAMATGFNGFYSEENIINISDEPLMTMYVENHSVNGKVEIVAA